MSEAIVAQVLLANRRFYDALEALDLEAMGACWSTRPDVACLHPGGPWQRGWEDVREGWEAIMSGTGYIEFAIEDAVVSLADPLAWVTCTERVTAAAAGGASGTSGAAEAAATNVFLLENTGWRMVLHHASPVIRPAPSGDDPEG